MTLSQNSKAISEVNAILKQLNHTSLNKIPEKLLDEFEKNATVNVDYINSNIPLEELELQEETKEIIAVISYTYFCNEEERKQWNIELVENERKYQEKLQKKYNPDNIFENVDVKNEDIETKSDKEISLMEYQESFFNKIWNKIKYFFSKKGNE